MGSTSQTSGASSASSGLDLNAYPYLARLERLQKSYPALRSLLLKLHNHGDRDEGRRLVAERYASSGRGAGRCAVLTFEEDQVRDRMFYSPEELSEYFEDQPPELATSKGMRRLFILEDMDVGFVDLLGQQLGVDPLIYSEQVNSWNYTDSQSIPHRALPSLNSPEKSWTLRYNEIRTLDDNEPARVFKSQMTHAINRRKWEVSAPEFTAGYISLTSSPYSDGRTLICLQSNLTRGMPLSEGVQAFGQATKENQMGGMVCLTSVACIK